MDENRLEELPGEQETGRRRLWLFLIPLLLLGLAFGFYKLVFVIKTVNAQPTVHYSAEQIVAAVAIPEGANLYSVNSLTVKEQVRRLCPYVEELGLERVVPDTVNVKITECTAEYYADIFGETWLLSGSLRLLERGDGKTEGLLRLKLPAVKEAVAGSAPVFDSSDVSYMAAVLTAARGSALYDRLNYIDLRDKNDLVMVSDGLYRLEFGSVSDVSVKLNLARSVLENPMFRTDSRAVLDLSDTKETSVIVDNEINLD